MLLKKNKKPPFPGKRDGGFRVATLIEDELVIFLLRDGNGITENTY